MRSLAFRPRQRILIGQGGCCSCSSRVLVLPLQIRSSLRVWARTQARIRFCLLRPRFALLGSRRRRSLRRRRSRRCAEGHV